MTKETDEQNEIELKKLMDGLSKATTEVKDWAKTAKNEMETLGKMTKESKDGADKALSEMNTKVTAMLDEFQKKTGARISDIEQKMARRGGGGVEFEEIKSAGQLVIENEGMKALSSSKRGSVQVSMERKNITSATSTVGTGVSPATSMVVPQREPIVPLAFRRLTIRDLLTPGQTISSNIEYPVETAYTNLAAATAEGAVKPQSDLTFDLKSAPVRTVAHFMKASRQILDDAPQLASYIDGRLRLGLELVEEAELLSGDGTGQHLLGIIPQASAYSGAFAVTGETAIDRLRLAILQTSLVFFPATGVVLHPTDWAKIEMTKDGMGRYIVGNPTGGMFTGSLTYVANLWGLPVVPTVAMTVNNFLTGAFRLGAQIFDRMSIEVLISTEDADNFQRNLISIRGEERLALAVYRPTAFVTGTLP